MKKSVVFIFLVLSSISVFGQTVHILDLEQQAEHMFLENRPYQSIALFKEIIGTNPSYFDARLGISRAYFSLGEYSEALIHIDKAMFLEPESIEAKILYGRILTGKGDFKEAEAVYGEILRVQPNNTDAVIAYAELEVAAGNIINALDLYEAALQKSPGNRRALISSIIIFDSIKKVDVSESYLDKILDLYPENGYVNYTAARHYYESGKLERALVFGIRSLDIDPDNQESIYLLGLIYTGMKEYRKAATLIENFLKIKRDNSDIWYLLGELYIKLNDIDKSLYSFSTAINYDIKDELSRIALENRLIEYKELDDPLRTRYSEFHFKTGVEFLNRNYSIKARNEFRRGLLISPHSSRGRRLYADLMKRLGYLNKYLSIIEDIALENPNDQDIGDEIEIYRSLNSGSVSEDWNIDQFVIDSPKYNIDLFVMNSGTAGSKYNEDYHLGTYFIHLLHGYENIEAQFSSGPVSFAGAYQAAHNNGSDYFIILSYSDSERSFSANAGIYHSGTGSLLMNIPVFRTGNNKLSDSLQIIARIFSNSLSEWSSIINRKFNSVLIDTGKIQGTKVGDIFYIVREEDFTIKKDQVGLVLDPGLILGEVEISRTDDLVSEGVLKKYQFFDIINPGDRLIKKTEDVNLPDSEALTETLLNSTDLYKSIISIP